MLILSYDFKLKDADEKIELLQINDIFDVFYESPLLITTDEFGYGYEEKEDDPIILKVACNDDSSTFNNFTKTVSSILGKEPSNSEEINYEITEFKLPPVYINDSYVLAHPDDTFDGLNKINFISQGAFGTGLHETTKDILNYILSNDFTNMDVLDIGTGSGILSIATGIKNAKSVTALDIRDVSDEVLLNASLNNLTNIDVKIGDTLSCDLVKNHKYDWIYINIGGMETELFMDFIKNHLKNDGNLLVSGLVTWSYDKIKAMVESNGFTLSKELVTNEWCTSIFKRR